MTTSMMALASSLMAILSLLIELGLLIWLIVAGRSSARALAIIGITLLLGARAVGFALPMAAGALGLWAVTASTVISGLLGLAGICCLAVAFMRTDRLAALSNGSATEVPHRRHGRPVRKTPIATTPAVPVSSRALSSAETSR